MDADEHRREDRTNVTFEEIGSHARHVTNVVADAIGDGCRVARIVFRNARFKLADQVTTDVRRLRVDASAHASEECNDRCSEAKACERRKRFAYANPLQEEKEHANESD